MEALPGDDAEIEWQLDAQDLGVVLRWIETSAAAADGVSIATGRTLNLVDTYLDTDDRRLERAGYAVRVRRERRRPPEATLKSLDGSSSDGLRIRIELTEQLEAEAPAAVARAPGPVGRRIRSLAGPRGLEPLFDLHTRRRVFPLATAAGPAGELVLDETTIRRPEGGILGRLRRVELEVPQPALGAVRPLVERLQLVCGLQPATLSKYESALAASGRTRIEAPDLGPTAIAPDDAIGRVGLAILRRHFSTLLAKEPGTRLGDDADDLHDMRVASRRLRAAIALFRDALPAEAERLRPEVAWLGRTIGAVRDLDVQLEQLDAWTELAPAPDREPLDRLRSLLAAEREQARAELIAALDSPRYEHLVRRFRTMLRSRTGTRTEAARATAPDLIERRHRKLRKAMRSLAGSYDPVAYHRVRIADKRFRYALESLADLYPGKTKPLVARAVALQDLLGEHQDAYVAGERLRGLAVDHGDELGSRTVFAMGEIAERHLRQMLEIRRRVPAVSARLDGKAWKRLRRQLEAGRPPAAPDGPS
jgi:CHAD domain-containing protein